MVVMARPHQSQAHPSRMLAEAVVLQTVLPVRAAPVAVVMPLVRQQHNQEPMAWVAVAVGVTPLEPLALVDQES